MKKEETMLLLQECDAGLKMAISSIDEVLDTIQNQEFKQLSIDIKNRHQKLKEEVDSVSYTHLTLPTILRV